MKQKVFEYKCEAITITYDVLRCTHVEACVRGLPEVFHPHARPWVTPRGADPDEIAEVILRCPTGSLHFVRHDGGPQEEPPDESTVVVNEDGPLYVFGDVEIVSHGNKTILRDTRIALCRCGASENMPLCDESHKEIGFEDGGELPPNCGDIEEPVQGEETLRVLLAPNGPLITRGTFTLRGADGEVAYFEGRTALCRCGASANKPFCDGTHTEIGFETE
jgi:CDGSH-type Zn-finger protein/uncharacterized Fe-S cluster protein YjdI